MCSAAWLQEVVRRCNSPQTSDIRQATKEGEKAFDNLRLRPVEVSPCEMAEDLQPLINEDTKIKYVF